MGCGCGCNKPPKGNFTYIRYASDVNGSDFAKTKTEGAIERCFQAIIVSPIALDEETVSFQALFNGKWFDVCNECGCGCQFFPYNTPDYITNNGENGWIFNTSTSPTYSTVPSVSNDIFAVKMNNGSLLAIPNFRDEDDIPLVSGTEYCVEFDLVQAPTGEGSTVLLSLGDGAGATVHTLSYGDAVGTIKLKMTAQDGAGFLATQLVMEVVVSNGDVGFHIENFHIGPSECCEDGGTCDIVMEQKEDHTLGPVVRFVKADFDTATDVVEPGVLVLDRASNGAGIFNTITETGWDNPVAGISPEGTLWNSIYSDPLNYGFADLGNVDNRVFTNFKAACNNQIGNELPALEMIMLVVATGKYYKVDWQAWTQGGNGGGFAYDRQEITLITPCSITFSDGKKQEHAAPKIKVGAGLTATPSINNDGTCTLLIESSGDVNTWDIPDTAFVSASGNDATGVKGDGNKPYQTLAAAQAVANNVIIKTGIYFGTFTLISNRNIYCMPGVVFASGSRFTDGGLTVTNTNILGYAEFGLFSYGVELLGAGSQVYVECDRFERSRSICFLLGAGTECIIKAKRGFNATGNNGGGYSCTVRGNSRLELYAESGYCYTDHWLVASGTGGGSFLLRCPDVRILDGGAFGNIAKSLVNVQANTTGAGGEFTSEVDFLGGTMRMEHAVQASSFGVRDSALLLFVNDSGNATHSMRFSNGTVDAGVGLGLLIEYIVLAGYVECDNIKIVSQSKPVEMSQRATAASGYCEFVAKDCEFEGDLGCEFGNGRIARLFNTTVKIRTGASIFTFNNANATSAGQLYLVNCNTQLDAGGGETFTGFATATIGSLNHHSTEVIGVGAVDSYGGFNQVATIELPNIKI